MELLSKLLYVVFFLSLVNVLRHLFFLIQQIINGEKYNLEKQPLLILGISISVILAIIFTGFKI